MKLVRVGNLSVLPMESIPWADYDDSCAEEIAKPQDPGSFCHEGAQHKSECEHGDGDLEMQDSKNIPPERDHCKQAYALGGFSNGCPGRHDSLNAGSFSRNHLPAHRYRNSNSTYINPRAIAPRISSSRCYAPRDQHRSASTGGFRDAISRGNIGSELRSPSKGYDDRIRETVLHRGMGAKRFVGTKRLGREATLCEASECKRHSRGDSSQQHRYERGFWRVDKKLGELDLRHTLNQKANKESGVEGRRWRRKAPAYVSPPVEPDSKRVQMPQHSADVKGSLEGDRSADAGSKTQYEMFASLLFKDSCDAEGSTKGIVETEVSQALQPEPAERKETLEADGRSEGQSDLNMLPSSPTVYSAGHEELATNCRLGKQLRVFVDVTNKFTIHADSAVKEQAMETDPHRLSQRQRQIDFGKNTLGYERYNEVVPRWKRTKSDPRTPNPRQVCSKRSWDGQIRKWRRLLHAYDPPLEDGEEVAEVFTMNESTVEPMEVCNLLASSARALETQIRTLSTCDEHEHNFDALMILQETPPQGTCIEPASSFLGV